jgi:hypothetical protein
MPDTLHLSRKLPTHYRRQAEASLDTLVTVRSAILQAIVSLRVVGLEPPLVLRQKTAGGGFFLHPQSTTGLVLFQVHTPALSLRLPFGGLAL